MKRMSRLLFLLCCLVILVAVLAVPAMASTIHSVDEAISWCYSQLGKSIDTDGYPSGQPYQYVLLLFCGLLTVIPLALFGSAAQKVSMFTLGLLEYISPTISMILAIFLFREPFDRIQFLAFLIIWIGLGFFTVGEVRSQTNAKPSIDFSSSALKE